MVGLRVVGWWWDCEAWGGGRLVSGVVGLVRHRVVGLVRYRVVGLCGGVVEGL
jgi:3'-phosphoadenosine 5'-phosphosulfate sulfotransferase